MDNIILIGMSGAGKSTIGVLIAKILGYKFIDTDLIIQEQQCKLLQEIIDQNGMDEFLNAEEYAITKLHTNKTVIATGGSVIYSESGMVNLKSLGKVLYLNVPCEEIERRLDDITTRGIIMGKHKTFRSLYEEREKLYAKYADIEVHCKTLSMEQVVATICNILLYNIQIVNKR